jgi:Tol biopolymer transport system component
MLLALGLGLFVGRQPAVQIKERRLTANPSEVPVRSAVISPDGKYVAFSDDTGFYLRQIDSGETHPVPLPRGFNARPLSWFPDAAHLIAGWVAGLNEGQSLWEISINGGNPRKLVDQGQRPSVSPDGTQVAFLKKAPGEQQIWSMQRNGEHAQLEIVEPAYEIGELAWSTDGRRLAYTKARYLEPHARIDDRY